MKIFKLIDFIEIIDEASKTDTAFLGTLAISVRKAAEEKAARETSGPFQVPTTAAFHKMLEYKVAEASLLGSPEDKLFTAIERVEVLAELNRTNVAVNWAIRDEAYAAVLAVLREVVHER